MVFGCEQDGNFDHVKNGYGLDVHAHCVSCPFPSGSNPGKDQHFVVRIVSLGLFVKECQSADLTAPHKLLVYPKSVPGKAELQKKRDKKI